MDPKLSGSPGALWQGSNWIIVTSYFEQINIQPPSPTTLSPHLTQDSKGEHSSSFYRYSFAFQFRLWRIVRRLLYSCADNEIDYFHTPLQLDHRSLRGVTYRQFVWERERVNDARSHKWSIKKFWRVRVFKFWSWLDPKKFESISFEPVLV